MEAELVGVVITRTGISSEISGDAQSNLAKAIQSEVGSSSTAQLKSLDDEMRSIATQLSANTKLLRANPPLKKREKLKQAQRALHVKKMDLSVKRNEIISSPKNTAEKLEIVNRGRTSSIVTTSLVRTEAAGPIDSKKAALAKEQADREGAVVSNEKSSGVIPKDSRIASLEIRGPGAASRITIREFFITGVSENTAEKFQIVQTFGSDYIFFFNKKPLIYTVNGVFHNSVGKDWKNEFRAMYDNFLRGTKLVEGRNKALFTYDDVTREGYLLSLNYNMDSSNQNAIPFSFSMFITSESQIGAKVEKELSDNQKSSEATKTTLKKYTSSVIDKT